MLSPCPGGPWNRRGSGGRAGGAGPPAQLWLNSEKWQLSRAMTLHPPCTVCRGKGSQIPLLSTPSLSPATALGKAMPVFGFINYQAKRTVRSESQRCPTEDGLEQLELFASGLYSGSVCGGRIRDKHQALPHSTAPTGPGHLQSYSTAKNQRNEGKQRQGWCQAAQPLLPGILGDGGGIWGWGLKEEFEYWEQFLFPCMEQIVTACVSIPMTSSWGCA